MTIRTSLMRRGHAHGLCLQYSRRLIPGRMASCASGRNGFAVPECPWWFGAGGVMQPEVAVDETALL
jgi:hypothetical protein